MKWLNWTNLKFRRLNRIKVKLKNWNESQSNLNKLYFNLKWILLMVITDFFLFLKIIIEEA